MTGAHTIQNNGLIGGLITPHTGVGLTNFIGFNNGLFYPSHSATMVTIVTGFIYCVNGYAGFTLGAELTAIEAITMAIRIEFKGVLNTSATVTITEGFETIFECGFESPNGVFLATNNNEMVGLFEALYSAFDTTNDGDIGYILSPHTIQNRVEFVGLFDTPFIVFNEMNDSKINENKNKNKQDQQQQSVFVFPSQRQQDYQQGQQPLPGGQKYEQQRPVNQIFSPRSQALLKKGEARKQFIKQLYQN